MDHCPARTPACVNRHAHRGTWLPLRPWLMLLLFGLAAWSGMANPVAADANKATFKPDTTTQHQIGSGRDIPFNFHGSMPQGGDVLVLAWSDREHRMVHEFAHILREQPWVIRSHQLDKLPTGHVNLQLLYRVNGVIHRLEDHWINVHPANEPPDHRDELIAFSDDFPIVYYQGTNQVLTFDVFRTLPNKTDVLVLAWSTPERRMVNEFAHSLTDGPWQIRNDKMDILPAGIANVQLLYRVHWYPLVRVTTNVLIVPPSAIPQPDEQEQDMQEEEPAGDEPSQADEDPMEESDPALDEWPAEQGDETADDQQQDEEEKEDDQTDPTESDEQNNPMPQGPYEGGYSDLAPSADSRVIHVSSSHGNDANDGLSPQRPVRSIQRGAQLLRDGYPDWLLLRRGDQFHEGSNGGTDVYWNKSGRNANEPMVIGAYGYGPRPRINLDDRGFINNFQRRMVRHVVFTSLHLYSNYDDPNGPDFRGPNTGAIGIRWLAPTENVTFEDLLVEFTGILIQRLHSDMAFHDITVRRCVIRNAYSQPNLGHSSGLYVQDATNLTIEGCLFDHNGHNRDIAQSVRTIFNHNVYLNHVNGLRFTGNISARASSFGLKVRSDHTGGSRDILIENNLFLLNGNTMTISGDPDQYGRRHDFVYDNVIVRNNVFTRSGAVIQNQSQGLGLSLRSMRNAVIEGNLFVDKPFHNYSHAIASGDERMENVVVRYNVVHNWIGGAFNTQAQVYDNNVNLPGYYYLDAARSINTYGKDIEALTPYVDRGPEKLLEKIGEMDRKTYDVELDARHIVEYFRQGYTINN